MATTQSQRSTQSHLNGSGGQQQGTQAVKKASGQTSKAKRPSQAAARKRAQAPETFATQVAGVAETAILVPVGVTLEARDAVVEAITPWTSRSGAEKELNRVRRDVRRYERRGTRAVRGLRRRYNRVLREVRKRRTATERVVKRNRTQAERVVKQNRRRVEKTVRPQVTRVQRSVTQQTKEARERVQALI